MSAKSSTDFSLLSDEVLILQVAAENVAAFSELYDRYSPRLYGLAMKILRDPVLADDVLQEVFLNVWKKAGSFDAQRGYLPGWLSILCRNRCIDALRSREKRRQRSVEINEATLSLPGVADPMQDTLNSQRGDVLRIHLGRLPLEQRTLIEMAYFEGYSQSEISERLQIPLGTVKTRIRLGMNKLRERLIPRSE